MERPTFTFILNGNTYKLSVDDRESIRKIPSTVRQQLVELLEFVKREEHRTQQAVQKAVDNVKTSSSIATKINNVENSSVSKQSRPERLGSGDVDALMARLILEEKQNQKPGLTKQTLYKWLAGFVVVVILLIFIF